MPKVTITFDCPEENIELRQAIDGYRWELVVWDLDQWLRSKVKYEENPTLHAEVVRDKLCELLEGLEFSP